jgi:hypothetical protein
MLVSPRKSTDRQCAFVFNSMNTKAHTSILITESDILLKYLLAADLDKTQKPYNDKWSCPIPPQENRVKVRMEAGEKTFKKNGEACPDLAQDQSSAAAMLTE